jgi:NAD(P)-dependent dehydrogenase (short-subunit alcohol dehydrogenase family)
VSVALVTGAAGGIGAAGGRAFEAAGFTTIGIDREQADLTDAEAVAGLFGRLDRLDAFTAHGISGTRFGDGPVDRCTDEGWEIVLAMAPFVAGAVLTVDGGWTTR